MTKMPYIYYVTINMCVHYIRSDMRDVWKFNPFMLSLIIPHIHANILYGITPS